jgi:hypothetical protein
MRRGRAGDTRDLVVAATRPRRSSRRSLRTGRSTTGRALSSPSPEGRDRRGDQTPRLAADAQ